MKYTLKAQSVVTLRQILMIPGWAKTIDQIYRGGKILVSALPEVKEGVPVNNKVSFELDGPDRDSCKVALEYALTKELVPAGPFVNDILETLEFVPKSVAA